MLFSEHCFQDLVMHQPIYTLQQPCVVSILQIKLAGSEMLSNLSEITQPVNEIQPL